VKTERRFSCGDHERLEYPLEDKHGERKKKCAAVKDTACKHFTGCTHGGGKKGHKKVTQGGKQYAPGESGKDDKRKKAVRFFCLPLPHGLCYEGAAACAEHESDTRENHDGGEDQVDRGECRFAHIVRYEKSVDHGVGGNEDHHYHGGQDETEKSFIIETGGNVYMHKGSLKKK